MYLILEKVSVTTILQSQYYQGVKDDFLMLNQQVLVHSYTCSY